MKNDWSLSSCNLTGLHSRYRDRVFPVCVFAAAAQAPATDEPWSGAAPPNSLETLRLFVVCPSNRVTGAVLLRTVGGGLEARAMQFIVYLFIYLFIYLFVLIRLPATHCVTGYTAEITWYTEAGTSSIFPVVNGHYGVNH